MSVILVEGDCVTTTRKRSCGKVMFSDMFVGGGAILSRGSHGSHERGWGFREETPSSVGEQAGGTHPTGMHSCYRLQTKFGVR